MAASAPPPTVHIPLTEDDRLVRRTVPVGGVVAAAALALYVWSRLCRFMSYKKFMFSYASDQCHYLGLSSIMRAECSNIVARYILQLPLYN